MVDARDIARAHVRAAERPQAKGRYLCTTEKSVTGKQIQKALENRFPEYTFNQMEDGESTRIADNGKVTPIFIQLRISYPCHACAKPQNEDHLSCLIGWQTWESLDLSHDHGGHQTASVCLHDQSASTTQTIFILMSI